jgi:hypothetical protein
MLRPLGEGFFGARRRGLSRFGPHRVEKLIQGSPERDPAESQVRRSDLREAVETASHAAVDHLITEARGSRRRISDLSRLRDDDRLRRRVILSRPR